MNKYRDIDTISDNEDEEFTLSSKRLCATKSEAHKMTTRSATSAAIIATNSEKQKEALDDDTAENVVFTAIKETRKESNTEASVTATSNKSVRKSNTNNTAYTLVKPVFSRTPFAINTRKLLFGRTKLLPSSSSITNKKMYDRQCRINQKYAFDPEYQRTRLFKRKEYDVSERNNNNATEESNKKRKANNEGTTNEQDNNENKLKTVQDEMKEQQNFIKGEFSVGSLVSMEGKTLDPEKYENEKDAPIFYGVVKDISHVNWRLNLNCNTDETLVEFVLAGEYKWCNKRGQNTIFKVVKTKDLTLKSLPSSLFQNPFQQVTADYHKWFEQTEHNGWKVMIFRNPCLTCGSPYCMYKNNKDVLMATIRKVDKLDNISNAGKRQRAYFDGVKAVYPHLGKGNRVRLGFCFVESVRGVFPDEEYKGFRYSESQKTGV